MKISIIMPCHNRLDALRLTLDGLCKQTFPSDDFEVIVVDQASTDGSRELVRSLETPFSLRLLEQDQKYGISVARNGGIAVARFPLILILDADVIPSEGLIAGHATSHIAKPEAIICGRVMPYLPAYTTYIEQCANPDAGYDHGDQPNIKPFYNAFGNNISMTQSVFEQVGPFDPDLKGFEDIEFAYRANKLGIPIINCPNGLGFHNHPRTLLERCEQVHTYNRMIPILFQRFPELQGQIPGISDFESISWSAGDVRTIVEKILTRFYGMEIIRNFNLHILRFIENYLHVARLARFFYWRLVKGYGYLGFHEGYKSLSTLT